MKGQIQVSRTELLNKLSVVGKVLSNKNLIPAHDNFLFEGKDGKLYVTGADREGNITKEIECTIDVAGDFNFMIDHKIITEGLKVLAEQPITIIFNVDSNSAELKHQSGSYNLPILSGDDFSVMKNSDEDVKSVTIDSQVLYDGIKKVIAFSGDDELRPIMNSVFVECKTGVLSFVSSNAHMLGIYEVAGQQIEDFSVVLPKKFAKIISDFTSDEDSISFEIGPRNISASLEGTTIVYRLIEGVYPNFRAVVPKNNDKEIRADVASCKGAVKRTSIFANKNSALIILNAGVSSLVISAKDVDFNQSAQESLNIDYNSLTPIEIGFKSEFLLQCLNTIDTDQVSITMREPTTAALISEIGSEDDHTSLTILIMPMMINTK